MHVRVKDVLDREASRSSDPHLDRNFRVIDQNSM
jgi:hypothetical protein